MTEIKTIKDFIILPPRPGSCSICGVKHDSDLPHNAYSLYYKYRFYKKYSRFPTQEDACAHVTKEITNCFKTTLIKSNCKFTKTEYPIAEPYKVQE